MKIAWFGQIASARRNGKVSYSRIILNELARRDFQVVFFYHAMPDPDLVVPASSRAVRMDALNLWNRATVSSFGAKRTIQTVLQEERPQLAHVSFSFSNLDSSIPDLCHAHNISVVGTWHMPFGPLASFWGMAMDLAYRLSVNTLNKYDALIVFSDAQKQILVRHGVKSTRLHVIPNGIDVNTFAPGPSGYKNELGARLLISYVGRVDPEKNVDVLCDAFRSLGLPADHMLVIAGAGLIPSHQSCLTDRPA